MFARLNAAVGFGNDVAHKIARIAGELPLGSRIRGVAGKEIEVEHLPQRIKFLGGENIEEIKRYIINPVDSREAELGLPETLILPSEEVKDVETVNISGRSSGELIKQYGLAMDEADMDMLKAYFVDENREPTLTEIRVLDTYW